MTAFLKYALVLCVLMNPVISFASDDGQYAKRRERISAYGKEIRSIAMKDWPLQERHKADGKGLSASLKVFIGERGKIISHEWVKKTGDESFNDSCVSLI